MYGKFWVYVSVILGACFFPTDCKAQSYSVQPVPIGQSCRHACPNCRGRLPLQFGLSRDHSGCLVCDYQAKEGKEKKTVFVVKTEAICIPPVQLPFWGTISCGKIRRIKVLEKETIECPNCEHIWSVKDLCKVPEVSRER